MMFHDLFNSYFRTLLYALLLVCSALHQAVASAPRLGKSLCKGAPSQQLRLHNRL